MRLRFSFSLCLITAVACAAPVPDFATALERAKTAKIPIAVLVRGSDWNKPGEILAKAWHDPAFERELGDAVLTVDMDIKENPTPEDEALAKRNEAGQPPYRGLPAIALYDCDGRLVALRSGVGEIREAGGAAGVLKAMRKTLAQRDDYWKRGHGAGGARKAELLGGGLDVMGRGLGHKNCYQGVLDEIRKADPEDRAGYIGKYMFSSWELLGMAIGRAGKKEFTEAERDLAAALAKLRLTPQQRQEVHAARFALYQRWPERKADARKALGEIVKIDAKSLLGRAAANYLRLYKD